MKFNQLLQTFNVNSRVGPQYNIEFGQNFISSVEAIPESINMDSGDVILRLLGSNCASDFPNFWSRIRIPTSINSQVFNVLYANLVLLCIAILNDAPEFDDEIDDEIDDDFEDDDECENCIRYEKTHYRDAPRPEPCSEPTQKIEQPKKESYMKNVINRNQVIAKQAVEIEIGKTGLTVLKTTLKQMKVLPPMVVGYLDTPVGDLVCANLLIMIGEQVRNQKVQLVGANALSAAWLNLMSSFNIQDLVDKILTNSSLQNLMTQVSDGVAPAAPAPASGK